MTTVILAQREQLHVFPRRTVALIYCSQAEREKCIKRFVFESLDAGKSITIELPTSGSIEDTVV
jgi:hypothetical protein